ncbi:MAG: glycosyl hydrolase [Armatimonadota bacterium]|nr:glycosyl hydrolase [Armatimonadota bacterium]
MKLPQSDRLLTERFINPPAESRILKIIHNWPDDSKAQDNLISKLSDAGFGGVVCNVSFDKYLESEEKWVAFVRAVKAANKMGMSLWLYDEKGYPSGTAGGLTMRDHPEWEARGLLIADKECEGGEVNLGLPPGKLIMAIAYPAERGKISINRGIDLSAYIHEGTLSWNTAAGNWHVFAITEDYLYESTHAQISLADKLHYINLLMPEPTARFIDVTYGAYAKHLGSNLGKWFVATFTDEPSLMSFWFNRMPYRVIPWSPNLPIEFEKRRGYDLKPLIPLLIVGDGEREKKVRYDFWLTVGELVSENFFGQIQAYCRKHNIPSGGHLLMEESLAAHVAFYGDFFRCIRRLDAPSIDCLTSIPSEVPWHIARLISSAADLENKPITMCETSDFIQRYRPQGDTRPVRDVTEAEIRGTCNRLILNGITTITSYYSFSGLSTEQLRRLNTYIGRCCTMLKGGYQVADIAVVYPIESLWLKFVPAYQYATDSPEARKVEDTFNRVSRQLWKCGYDFTYIDARTLSEARVENGTLVHGKLRWKVVILPYVDTLPIKAWENLAKFERSGGTVISIGALPANSENEFPSPKVEHLAKTLFARADTANNKAIFLDAGCEDKLPDILSSVTKLDIEFPPDSPIRFTHRRINGNDVYFVINDSDQLWDGVARIAVANECEIWNPTIGEIKRLNSKRDVRIELGPYEGVFLYFPSR